MTDNSTLKDRTIAFLVATEGIEQVELTRPRDRADAEGATTHLVSTDTGEVQAFNHLDKADTFPVDRVVSKVSADDYDALVLPGGVANPDALRMDSDAVDFVRDFVVQGKPVAVICHGPWTLVEADVVSGRTLTSWPSVATDLRNAGATWVDEEVVTCDCGPGLIVSSRNPDDLDAFCDEMVKVVAAFDPSQTTELAG